jgi:hypothetical protein
MNVLGIMLARENFKNLKTPTTLFVVRFYFFIHKKILSEISPSFSKY